MMRPGKGEKNECLYWEKKRFFGNQEKTEFIMTSSKRTSIRMYMRDYLYIKRLAERTGVKKSEIIRYMIKNAVESLERAEQSMKKKRKFTE